jgi:hypothetical protein
MTIRTEKAHLVAEAINRKFGLGIAAFRQEVPGIVIITEWREEKAGRKVPDEKEVLEAIAELEAAQEKVAHVPARAAAYHPLGDVVDAMRKGFARIKEAGIDIGPEMEAEIEHAEKVKAENPKAEE